MRSLFNYDSKIMQALMVVGDLIILNILFLICCIPIVTIGAAQAGLYSGIRVLTDKEDDSSCIGAFFKGLRTGFWRITLVWCILLALLSIVAFNFVPVYILENSGLPQAPVWLSIIGICICGMFQSLTCWFHSRFSCKAMQLFRNAWLILLAHPLRALVITVLNWLPLIIAAVDFYLFMQLTPLILAVGFSTMYLFSFSIMKKPFQDLLEIYNQKNAPPEPPAPQESQELT